MSNRTIIYYDDLVSLSTTTLTASSEVAGYEKEFIQDYTPQSLWQSSADPATMSYDFGSIVKITAAWHGGSNMVAADTTYQIRYGTAAPSVDSPIYALDQQADSFVETIEEYEYGMTTINKAAGNGEVGKVYIASSKFELVKDFKSNYTGGTMSEYITNPGRYGQINRELKYSKVIYSFDMVGMGDVQKKILDETIRKQENVLFWDAEMQKAFFGVISFGQPKLMVKKPTGNLWQMSGTFEEAK